MDNGYVVTTHLNSDNSNAFHHKVLSFSRKYLTASSCRVPMNRKSQVSMSCAGSSWCFRTTKDLWANYARLAYRARLLLLSVLLPAQSQSLSPSPRIWASGCCVTLSWPLSLASLDKMWDRNQQSLCSLFFRTDANNKTEIIIQDSLGPRTSLYSILTQLSF